MIGGLRNTGIAAGRILACGAVAGALGLAAQARATVVTFAQFQEVNEPANGIKWTVPTTTGGLTVNSPTGSQDVNFSFENVPGLPAAWQGVIPAKLRVAGSTTAPASSTRITSNNTILSQPFSGPITMIITANTPYTPPHSTERLSNLLTVTVSPDTAQAVLSGRKSSSAGTLQATYCGNADTTDGCDPTSSSEVTYQSDALDFSKVNSSPNSQTDLSLSLSAIVPTLANGSNGLLQNFNANWTGTFDADPPPTVSPALTIDEPASASALCVGLLGLGMARRGARSRRDRSRPNSRRL